MSNKEREKRIARQVANVTRCMAFGMIGAAVALLATGTVDGWTGVRLVLGALGIVLLSELARRDDILDGMTNEDV